jgi:hypothetical protein
MRSARFGLLFCLQLLLSATVWAQQPQAPANRSSSAPSFAPAQKDPQALNTLNQALAAAGGASAIGAIKDYTATGNVTYNWNPAVQGSVTVLGLGLNEYRVDANLPRGVRSSVVSFGQTTTKSEEGVLSQYPRPYPVPSSDAFPYQPPMFPGSLIFPYEQLVAVVNTPRFNVSNKGVVQVDGHSAYDIHVQWIVAGPADLASEYHTRDFYVDTSTSQLLMTQDIVPKHTVHVIRYSDYRAVNGVLVPFSITEAMGGQQTWAIQLSQFTFNTGLQDASFVLK